MVAVTLTAQRYIHVADRLEGRMGGVLKDKQVRIGGIGAIVAFLACMTPMILVPMALIGVGAWFDPLDTYLLVPGMVLFFAVLLHGIYRHWKRGDTAEEPHSAS